jgi:hypothetical protein
MMPCMLSNGCESRVIRQVRPAMIHRMPFPPYGRFRQGLNAACRRYLAFAPEYRHLEEQIAWETVGWTTDPRNDGVGCNQNLSFDTMAVLAVRAYIRHRCTDYDRRKRVASRCFDQRNIFYPPLRSMAERQVDKFINRHRNIGRFSY